MFTHLLSNNLVKIRNAFASGKKEVAVTLSNINISIVRLLHQEGLISDFTIKKIGSFFWIFLQPKYAGTTPTIQNITQTSKSGRRNYQTLSELKLGSSRGGIILIMTSRGLFSHKTALRLGIGGEMLCHVS